MYTVRLAAGRVPGSCSRALSPKAMLGSAMFKLCFSKYSYLNF